MIDWKNHLLGKEVIIYTTNYGVYSGRFEGAQKMTTAQNPFYVVKLEGDEAEIEGKYVLIPEKLVERIYVVSEQSIHGQDGEGS